MRGFSSREHQEMSFGARGTVFGLASTVEAGLVLAGGDLAVASTRGGGLVLAEVIGLAGASGEALELIIFRKI